MPTIYVAHDITMNMCKAVWLYLSVVNRSILSCRSFGTAHANSDILFQKKVKEKKSHPRGNFFGVSSFLFWADMVLCFLFYCSGRVVLGNIVFVMHILCTSHTTCPFSLPLFSAIIMLLLRFHVPLNRVDTFSWPGREKGETSWKAWGERIHQKQ